MNNDYDNSPLSRSVMAGLGTGIIATVINLIYNYVYRDITDFSLTVSFINIGTISFANLLLGVLAGLAYYFVVFRLKTNKVVFVALFMILTVLVIIPGMSFHRSSNLVISRQFEGLYLGMVVITGLFTALGIPWLLTHKNVFTSDTLQP